MSVTKETVIWCGHCGNWERLEFTPKAPVARKNAKHLGWARQGYKDYCSPECAEIAKVEKHNAT